MASRPALLRLSGVTVTTVIAVLCGSSGGAGGRPSARGLTLGSGHLLSRLHATRLHAWRVRSPANWPGAAGRSKTGLVTPLSERGRAATEAMVALANGAGSGTRVTCVNATAKRLATILAGTSRDDALCRAIRDSTSSSA